MSAKIKQRPPTTWAREAVVLKSDRVAMILGISVDQLRYLAQTGQVPAFKVGSQWRFEKEALMRFVGVQDGGTQ